MRANRREFVTLCSGALAGGAFAGSALPAHLQGQPFSAARSNGQKIIVDADTGVDDAFALLLAMRSPELHVLAITAVAGNVPLSITLPNALRLVEIANRTDIPVAAGAQGPLIRKLVDAAYAHGNNGLAGVEFPAPRLKPVQEPAAALISRLVRENPGEVTIVGIGPLTNVAMALRQYPEIAPMVRSIVVMGGSLSGGNVTPAAEFNFYVDPEAASMVFNSGIPIRMVGLDVTQKINLTGDHIEALRADTGAVSQAAARIADAVMKMYRAEHTSSAPHLHDPLALSCLLRPDILTFEDFHVEIETSGSITAGESVGWRHAPLRYAAPLLSAGAGEAPVSFNANAQVAIAVQPERFFDLLISRLTRDSA